MGLAQALRTWQPQRQVSAAWSLHPHHAPPKFALTIFSQTIISMSNASQ